MAARTSISLVSDAVEETRAAGARLARGLSPGSLILLSGPLGAGKTAFAQGVARGLGIADRVTSPSFVLVREYECGDGMRLVHVDFYRLSGPPEALDLGIDDYLLSDDIVIVEWPENVGAALPEEHLKIAIRFAEDHRRHPHRRRIAMEAVGPKAQRALLTYISREREAARARPAG